MLGALYQINNISSSIIFVDGIWTSCDSPDCIDKCLRNKQSRHLVCLRVFAKMINLALIWAAPFHTLGDQDGIKGQGLKRELSSTNSSPLSRHCYVSYSTTLFSLPQWTETLRRWDKVNLTYFICAWLVFVTAIASTMTTWSIHACMPCQSSYPAHCRDSVSGS